MKKTTIVVLRFRFCCGGVLSVALPYSCVLQTRQVFPRICFRWRDVSDVRLSPLRGPTLLFVLTTSIRPNNANLDICRIRFRRRAAKHITDGASSDSRPRWSPDGKYIACEANRAGRSGLWALNQTRNIQSIAPWPHRDFYISHHSEIIAWSADSKGECLCGCGARGFAAIVDARFITSAKYKVATAFSDDRRRRFFAVSIEDHKFLQLTHGNLRLALDLLGLSRRNRFSRSKPSDPTRMRNFPLR